MLRIGFIIDDGNYSGGATVAARRLCDALERLGGFSSILLSGTEGELGKLASAYVFAKAHSVKDVLFAADVPWRIKLRKAASSVLRRFGGGLPPLPWAVRIRVRANLENYDVLCVCSEDSLFRETVAELPCLIRKIQLVHTDYPAWADFTRRSPFERRSDVRNFARMDQILIIGERCTANFKKAFPVLSSRCSPFRNILPSIWDGRPATSAGPIRLLSIMRLEREKDPWRIVRLARRLKAECGNAFEWVVMGSGHELGRLQNMCARYGISGVLRFVGYVPDPFLQDDSPDLTVLLSHYEGLPNVIYESMIQHIPVLATAVGGIPEQIEDGVNGCLVADDEESICAKMREVIHRPELLRKWKDALLNYVYNNDDVRDEFVRLLFK